MQAQSIIWEALTCTQVSFGMAILMPRITTYFIYIIFHFQNTSCHFKHQGAYLCDLFTWKENHFKLSRLSKLSRFIAQSNRGPTAYRAYRPHSNGSATVICAHLSRNGWRLCVYDTCRPNLHQSKWQGRAGVHARAWLQTVNMGDVGGAVKVVSRITLTFQGSSDALLRALHS